MLRNKFANVDEYISSFSGETKKRLDEIRAKIFDIIPTAEERISYNIPAYFLDKKLVVYFSGYANHVSLYPGRTLSLEYTKLAAEYASGKSTLKFPNTKPLPIELIEQFVKIRLKELGA